MNTKGKTFRQVLGIAGIIVLIAGFIVLLNLYVRSIPSRGPESATAYAADSTGRVDKSTSMPTYLMSPYPAPIDTPTYYPTPTLTTTPWTLNSLPPVANYADPGPYKEMWLLYSDTSSPGYYIIRSDGSGKIRWPDWPKEYNGAEISNSIRVSPAGGTVLYALWNGRENWDLASIWIMAIDGSNKQRLVATVDGKYPMDAIWSPDGKQIAYVLTTCNRDTTYCNHEIWIMDADGKNQRLLSKDPQIYQMDGFQYAYIFNWQQNGYIYFAAHSTLFALDTTSGTLFRLMDNVDSLGLRSAFSPDGIHFLAPAGSSTDLATKTGLTSVELPGKTGGISSWDWSGDGSRLVYTLYEPVDQAGIWIHDLRSNQDWLLVSDLDVEDRGLSPDGLYYAYQTNNGLYVLDVTTKKQQLLIQDPHDPGIPTQNAITFLAWIPVRNT